MARRCLVLLAWLAAGAAALAQSGPLPVRITADRDIDFARLAVEASGGSVKIDAATGSKSVSGGVIDLGGLHQGARFRLSGQANAVVLLGAPSVDLHYRSNRITMLADFGPSLIRTLDGNGRLTLDVGGVLTIPSGTAPGLYKGVLLLTASYANCFPVAQCVTVISRPLDAVVVNFE